MGMDSADAIDSHPSGCIIRFEVVPGSSRLAVPSGYNPWRRSLEARPTEEPSRGRANHQLVCELAGTLGLPASKIRVIKGEKSSRKLLLVKGIGKDMAASILEPVLEKHRDG